MSIYPATETAKMTEEVNTHVNPPPPQQIDPMEVYRSILRLNVAIRTLKPNLLARLNGDPVVPGGMPVSFRFQVDDAFVPVFALSIINSSTATQYVNIDAPASPVTFAIAAGTMFSYNLTYIKRLWVYSAAGVTVYPFAGQNVGSGSTGLYVQGWTNPEWRDMKGQGA